MASWRQAPWFWPLLFLAWVVLSEAAAILVGGDLGGMAFAGLHFAVNPFLGLVIAFFTLTKLRYESWAQRTVSMVGVGLVLCVGYLGVSGSIWPFAVLGLRFR